MLVFLFFFKDPYLYILFHSTTLHRAVFYHKNTFFVNFPLAAYADSRLTKVWNKTSINTHLCVIWSDISPDQHILTFVWKCRGCVCVVCTSLHISNVWLNIKVSCQHCEMLDFAPWWFFFINLLHGNRDISDWLTKCRSCDNTGTLKGLTSGLLNVFCLREMDVLCSVRVLIWFTVFICTKTAALCYDFTRFFGKILTESCAMHYEVFKP